MQRHRAFVRKGNGEKVPPRADAGREERQQRAAREVVVREEEGVGEVGLRLVAFAEEVVGRAD